MAKQKNVLYWITTVIVMLSIASGGIAELLHRPETIAGMQLLGYPVYFIMILGSWKIAGGIVLIIPRFPVLKEWAYAGIFFNMTGASISHLVCHDYGAYAFHIIVPLLLAGLAMTSRALRPPSRSLQ